MAVEVDAAGGAGGADAPVSAPALAKAEVGTTMLLVRHILQCAARPTNWFSSIERGLK